MQPTDAAEIHETIGIRSLFRHQFGVADALGVRDVGAEHLADRSGP